MKSLSTKVIALVIFAFLSCTVKLAPAYDQSLLDGMSSVSQSIMTLLSTTDSGTLQTDFSKREELYNSTIGSVEALLIQSLARPMPNNAIVDKVNEVLKRNNITPISDVTATSGALENISKNLVMMRNTDKKSGLNKTLVAGYKGNILLYLNQSITFEKFLNRE